MKSRLLKNILKGLLQVFCVAPGSSGWRNNQPIIAAGELFSYIVCFRQ